ncbi:hypothetical protein TVAGG3_0229930 [Trichomonas vaginalis G3]|uniref:hypothetical protein n=1 Tax=Trichomonas vaginalis (strain ATCC PRA-98 / G3) TaxID=412133 RepID=UPI0021E58CEB|nr:hypothetical protein TVAGG3_0229930 [Trichomonas vaginalis G3]KAI5552549.1 hypothetical protein TVAGG3_0229930 [Trichomonas vaginalis G3]
MQVSVVSLSPVCVSSLLFNNASINGGVFNPVNHLEINRDSLSVLDYISEETVGRDVTIDFDEAENIEFGKSEVSLNSGKSKYIITRNIGSKFEFIIHSDKLKIDCRSQIVSFAPNISFTSNPVVIFGDSWEFLNPDLTSSTKSVIRTYAREIHYYSITPSWPSNIFNITDNVEVSKGGYYCFHSESPNKCPPNYHEIEYKRIPIAKFHKNKLTKTITFYVDQSNSYSSPSISVSALAKLECNRLTVMSNGLSYMSIVLDSNEEISYPLCLNFTILTLKKQNSSEFKINNLIIMKGTTIVTMDKILVMPKNLIAYEPKFHLFSRFFLNSICDAEIHFSQSFKKILLGGNNFTIYDNSGVHFRFEPFKSLSLYFENEVYDIIRLELAKEYKEGTNYTIPSIISNANQITFSFHESCYEMTKWKKGLMRNPSGTMTLSTNKAYLPLNNFDIPAESEKVIYDVSKNVTSTPTPSDAFLSTKSIAIIASVVILVIVATLGLLAVVMKRHAAEKVMVSTDLLII